MALVTRCWSAPRSTVSYAADDCTLERGVTLTLAVNGSPTYRQLLAWPRAGYAGTVQTSGVLRISVCTTSIAESDNTIKVAGDGAERPVRSVHQRRCGRPADWSDGALDDLSDLNGASNETLVFDSGFGLDTVFNFDACTTAVRCGVDGAEDVFDFSCSSC